MKSNLNTALIDMVVTSALDDVGVYGTMLKNPGGEKEVASLNTLMDHTRAAVKEILEENGGTLEEHIHFTSYNLLNTLATLYVMHELRIKRDTNAVSKED